MRIETFSKHNSKIRQLVNLIRKSLDLYTLKNFEQLYILKSLYYKLFHNGYKIIVHIYSESSDVVNNHSSCLPVST